MDIIEIIRRELERRGTNPFRAAKEAGLPGNAIRYVLDGHEPKVGRLANICDALSLEFYIGPPRGEAAPAPPALDRFSSVDAPVRGWAKCSIFGELEGEESFPDLPAPEGLDDAGAFYALASGASMSPEGIEPGDYCLISPAAPLAPGARIWLKDMKGRAAIKRLVAEKETSYQLLGWREPDAAGRQVEYRDEWVKSIVVEKGLVLAVYRERPSAANPPPLIPDPRPRAGGAPGPPEAREAERTPFWAQSMKEEMAALRERPPWLDDLREEVAAVVADADDPETRHVEVVEINAAAGGGAEADTEEVAGRVPFRVEWLKRHRLDPGQCRVIGVLGESMEPTLPDGCSILVDMTRKRLRSGRIFLVRGEDGITVKRAVRKKNRWLLESEHPAWEPIHWSSEAEVLGEVVWMARTLIRGS